MNLHALLYLPVCLSVAHIAKNEATPSPERNWVYLAGLGASFLPAPGGLVCGLAIMAGAKVFESTCKINRLERYLGSHLVKGVLEGKTVWI